MNPLRTVTDVKLEDLIRLVADEIRVTPDEIVPFGDYTDFFTELLNMTCRPTSHLISAGHVTPEIEIAADRAEIGLTEVFGVSPFATEVEAVLHSVRSTGDIIYVANPNRVSGNSFSIEDLQAMAQAVPRGYLIIDEYYFEYSGVTGISLLEPLANVIVLRSFIGSFGIISIDAGYAVANHVTARQIAQSLEKQRLSTSVRKTILATLMNREAMTVRLQEVHDESLRICRELHKLGLQTRLSATDFVLLRVADPRRVGDMLARHKVPIDNLDGYRELNHFMRYRVQSPLSNDRLIDAFRAMPEELYRMSSVDSRSTILRRPGEKSQPHDRRNSVEEPETTERESIYVAEVSRE